MSTKNNLKISQAFLSLSKTCLAHKSLITEAKLKKKIGMTISHLFH